MANRCGADLSYSRCTMAINEISSVLDLVMCGDARTTEM